MRYDKMVCVKAYVMSFLMLWLGSSMWGCADESDIKGLGGQKLIDGALTEMRPEVGYLRLLAGSCTGTLIAPSVVITAAHCVNFSTQDRDWGYFELGGQYRYRVDASRSLSQTIGTSDIALLHLSERVPSSVATPAQIAQIDSLRDSPMTIYGFGCQDRETLSDGGSWHKQSVSFSYGHQTRHLCPGDSGGPVFDDTHGQMVLLNSAFYDYGGDDIFAAPFAYYQIISAAISELEGGEQSKGEAAYTNTQQVNQHTSFDTVREVSADDECARWGYYGDGYCDDDCAQPDPDCASDDL